MAFWKETNFQLNSDNTEILSADLEKTASFSLPEGFSFDPNYLYLVVRAVSAGEYWGCNKNSDFFPEEELKKGYKTFLSAHVFKNHENKQIENAIGDVLVARWNDNQKCVELILRIDKGVAPSIARGFERGFMTDVSMGCRIDHSICSICGNKAKTKFEYCDHIKFERGRIYDDGRKVFEINIAPKFHDISAVLNGAERSAKVLDLNLILNDNANEPPAENLVSVALSDDLKQLEKTASWKFEEAGDGRYRYMEPSLKLPHKFDKQASIQKISEIKKEIEGNILDSSVEELREEKERDLDKFRPYLKMLATKYFDNETCKEIGWKLRDIADETSNSDAAVFAKFLKMADSVGVEFTPKELYCIYSNLVDQPCDCMKENPYMADEDQKRVFDFIEHPADRPVLRGLGIANLLSAAPRVKGIVVKVMKKGPITPDVIDALLYKATSRTLPSDSSNMDFPVSDVLKSLFYKRMGDFTNSVPRTFNIPLTSSEFGKMLHGAISHYRPILYSLNSNYIKTAEDAENAIAAEIWNAYEAEREKWAEEDDAEQKAYHYASLVFDDEMEKSAELKDWIQTATIAVPAAYGYSALQRSRMRNGKKVSSINRAIGENPDLFAGAVGMATPHILKRTRPVVNRKIQQGKELSHNIGNKFTTLKSKFSRNKTAEDFSFLDNKAFEKFAEDAGIPVKEQDACKIYLFSQKLGNGIFADEMLQKMALCEEDVEEYLQYAKKFVKMNIDKYAEEKFASQTDLFGSNPAFLDDFVVYKMLEAVKQNFTE